MHLNAAPPLGWLFRTRRLAQKCIVLKNVPTILKHSLGVFLFSDWSVALILISSSLLHTFRTSHHIRVSIVLFSAHSSFLGRPLSFIYFVSIIIMSRGGGRKKNISKASLPSSMSLISGCGLASNTVTFCGNITAPFHPRRSTTSDLSSPL